MFGHSYTEGGIINYRTAGEVNQAMGRVYGYMGLATLVSMFVSGFIGTNPELVKFFFTGIMHWVVIFAPLLAVFGVTVALNANPPKEIALLLLAGFAAIMGLSFAVIFAVYTLHSIVTAFMGAAVLFCTMGFYGYFTKKSLDSLGKFMFVGLIAIVIASIINIFIGSTVMQMVISALAIVIFMGLTAYDTQQIREIVSTDSSPAVEVTGALTLYLDFINIFLSLLQLFGDKKD
jgi:FtsH-binding integral membrane protein